MAGGRAAVAAGAPGPLGERRGFPAPPAGHRRHRGHRRGAAGRVAVDAAGLTTVLLADPRGRRTWIVGGLASGPLHLGRMFGPEGGLRRPVLTPVVSGVGAFGAFYAAALVARRIPVLERAIGSVLSYADQGTTPLVLTTT